MSAEPWFDPSMAGWIGGLGGSIVGLWGGALGIAAGVLVPRGKGKAWVLGMLYIGVAAGVVLLVTGLVALITGQPYAVWYPLLLLGVLLTGLSIPFVFVLRRRYLEVELRKMRAEEMQ